MTKNNEKTSFNWHETNYTQLKNAIAYISNQIEKNINSAPNLANTAIQKGNFNEVTHSIAALEILSQLFGLSQFDRQLLILCAGMELDPNFAQLCAQFQGTPDLNYPTLHLALCLFEGSWTALAPYSPLCYWNLLEVQTSSSLSSSPLKLANWTLFYLLGNPIIDYRLEPFLIPVAGRDELILKSQRETAQLIYHHWQMLGKEQLIAPIQLVAQNAYDCRLVAQLAAKYLKYSLYEIDLINLPPDPQKLAKYKNLLKREAIANRNIYFINCEIFNSSAELGMSLHPLVSLINYLLENIPVNIVLYAKTPCKQFRIEPHYIYSNIFASHAEQSALWQHAFSGQEAKFIDKLSEITKHFTYSSEQIFKIAKSTLATANNQTNLEELAKNLRRACHNQFRSSLNNLAHFIEPKAQWADIILPKHNLAALQKIVDYFSHQSTVYKEWDVIAKTSRGLGLTALFYGASGVGKTLAAEIIANQLKLALLKVDLSKVISKYIGETEKNLDTLFNLAETNGCVLLFDEADSLFSSRSEVRDSHDRYANQEVSYLLQRIETYCGLCLLTTNYKTSLDQAFLRRFNFVINFNLPNHEQRLQIWRQLLEHKVTIAELDYQKLAQLPLSGSQIRNSILAIAFDSVINNKTITMPDIWQFAQAEMRKDEIPID